MSAPRRRPGRPPLDREAVSPSAPVHLTVTAADMTRLRRLADRNRETVQDVVRRELARLIDAEQHG